MTSSILIVSPVAADVRTIRSAFGQNPAAQLVHARTYGEAVKALMRDSFRLLLCDSSFSSTCWKDLLSHIAFLPDPPRFVLMSPAETRGSWAEAFNLGAGDVLATPLDGSEVRMLIETMMPKHYTASAVGATTKASSALVAR